MALIDLDPDTVRSDDVFAHVATAVGCDTLAAKAILQPIADRLLHMPGAERQELLEELATV